MGITAIFVSGPRRSGKSVVIREMINALAGVAPHYLRLSKRGGDKRRPRCAAPPDADCGVASASWLDYDPAQVFETLSECVRDISADDGNGLILIEGDTDPSLRHAYPYHRRAFIMAAPSNAHDVFRTNHQAAEALRAVLDDTTEFATEMFGLCCDGRISDDDRHEPRPDMTPAQLDRFLRSALGTELGLRCQLQPAYHGLIESDVILMNTAVGSASPVVDDVRHRLESMLQYVQRHRDQTVHLFCCDPLDPHDPLRGRFLDTLHRVCHTGS
jgi:hypothetical protein